VKTELPPVPDDWRSVFESLLEYIGDQIVGKLFPVAEHGTLPRCTGSSLILEWSFLPS
jgi:hypothetical protein